MLKRMLWVSLLGTAWIVGDARAQDAPPSEGRSIQELNWLTGCWEMSYGGLAVEEYWMPPRGGTMFGMNRVVRDQQTTGYEFLQIRAAGSELYLEANPSGQAPTEFAATGWNTERVIFENPEHDFPRRISYWRVGADSLRAEIDDGQGGRQMEFRYRRETCGR